MARRLVSWGGNEHIVSPNPLTTPSIVSVDSILQDKPDTSPTVQGTPNAAQSRTSNMTSQVMEPSRTRTWMSTSTYPGDDTADGLFVRHPKYFFKDGNITFLVDNTLYCVHRYFLSRDSIYFSTRFIQLDIPDHEALPTIISLGDIECKDFDAFLSVLYPENFEENYLCYEQWKSVLHLSTRWSFSSIRKLALSSIEPPTPYDRLILARTYSVHDWVVPALSALCERTTPLTLSEAHQVHIEDVILISSVREHIRGGTIQVDAAEIPLLVEAEQLVTLGHWIPAPSSRESEDDTPMAGVWHSRSRREKAEAEARAKAQEATRLRLDAEVRERGEAEEKACQEAEKARLDVEETTRKDAEEKVRLEDEKARKGEEERIRLEAEKARKAEKKRARLEVEKARKEEEERIRLEAEKVRKEERVSQEAEKARKAEEEMARLEAEKARKAEEKRARQQAEKARKAEEKRARLEAERARKAEEEKTRLEAEKARKEEEEKAHLEVEEKACLEVEEEKRKRAEEEVAEQRAADKAQKAARLAFSPSSGSSSPQSSGRGWLFSTMSQAMAASGQTDEPRSLPWGPAPTGSSDLFSKRQIKNISSPNALLGPRNPSFMRQSPSNPWQSSSNPPRDPLSSSSATTGTAARLPASVLSSWTTLVSEEVSITKGKQEGAKGEDNQIQSASETPAAPSSERASDNEAKVQPAEAIADKQSTQNGEGDGVLVEKADSSEDDSTVVVDAPQAVAEVEKAVGA